MLTYLNEHGRRTEVTNEQHIKAWYKVEEILNSLTDDEFNEVLEIISDYVFNSKSKKELTQTAERLGVQWRALTLWYVLEEE